MALTTTTLAGAFDANGLTFAATSTSGATVGGFCKIDDEFSVVTEIKSPMVTVRSRGDLATIAKAHAAGAPVTFGVNSDLPPSAPGVGVFTQGLDQQSSIGADGAVDVATLTGDTTIVITKATAAALTIAAPSKVQDTLKLTLLSATAFAHVVTYTAGFYGDTTGSDTATFAAKAGASVTLIARAGTWAVYATANVTIA